MLTSETEDILNSDEDISEILTDEFEELLPVKKKQTRSELMRAMMEDTFERNQNKIEEFYTKYLEENNRPPTKVEMAAGTGLTRQTIHNHFQRMNIEQIKPKHKIYFDKILMALAKKAMDGDTFAIKLYMQIVGNWTEKSITTTERNDIKTLRVEYIDSDNNMKRIETSNKADDIEFTELDSDESI